LRLVSELGEPVELKVVAALDRSLFQGELIISESNFLRVFPSQAGYSYFLVEAPPDCVDAVRAALERGLRDFGLDATTTAGRLAEFHAVENTYLATFQTLGGLGLVLGSLGLGIVLLRGVLERRSELALLRAVGYGHAALVWLVLAENAFLLVIGLGAGAGSALVAVAPHLWSAAAGVEWLPVTGTLLAVFGVGLLAGLVSLLTTVRTALLPALRAE
jgi:ABC-type antimicrobial peptide transport system permease subunit